MNFIFRDYPDHPWMNGWPIEPQGCNTAFRENNADLFFKTLGIVGQIAPNVEAPEWTLLIPIPQNSRINLLHNGFCGYFERRKRKMGAEILTPEPGVLWGRFHHIPAPVLIAEQQTGTPGQFQWIDSEHAPALLAVTETGFCLVTKARREEEAKQIAAGYLEKEIEAAFEKEIQRRAGAQKLFEEMTQHDALAAICVESMMRDLRPAEGHIPLPWCQSPSSTTPQLNVNEIHPLALAWKLIDSETAEKLLLCTLRIQANTGAIPVTCSPKSAHPTLEAPKPLLAKTVESVWEARKNPEFLEAALLPLRRHIQWLLTHFDPKRRGVYCWKSSSEPLVPDFYESDLSTVDLSILLLTEIEALNRLRRYSEKYAEGADWFENELSTLKINILEQFWNAEDAAFSNGYVRDAIVPLRGFPEFVPLLWDQLASHQHSAILDRVQEAGKLPGGLSVLSWRMSALDDDSFPLLQQLLVLQALQTADPHGSLLGDFSRITLQGFVEWHHLSLEEHNSIHINPVIAAYIMNVQAIRQYRYHAQGGISGAIFKLFKKAKADRNDIFIVFATVLTIYCVHLIYSVLNAPLPQETMMTQMTTAYSDRDMNAALNYGLLLIRHYPEDSDLARLLTGNILLLQQQYEPAEQLLAQFRKNQPDCPAGMVAHGLACQLQGKYKEAEQSYYEFCYLFDEIFPNAVEEIQRWRRLMEEGFSTPPKWQNIYRYRFMHEL